MVKNVITDLNQKEFHEVESYVWVTMEQRRETSSYEDNYKSYFVSICALAIMFQEVSRGQDLVHHVEKVIEDKTTISFLKNVGKEFSAEIDYLAKKFDLNTLKAAALFSGPQRFAELNENSTPEGISKLAASLLDINKDDSVLDLASGVGSFLFYVATEFSTCEKLYGVEIRTSNVIVANIRRFLLGVPVQITQGNMLSQDFKAMAATKVFSNPPLGMRLPDLQEHMAKNPELKRYFKNAKRTVSGDWVYALAAYLNTRPTGKTVVVMTNAGTWNKPEEHIRKKLIEEGTVEGVILLPERLLSTTAISLTIMILSQNNKEIRMVDASKIFTAGRRQNSLETSDVKQIYDAYHSGDNLYSIDVTVDEVAKEGYILNPKRYIGEFLDIEDGIPFKKICKSINRGAMIKSAELDQLVTTEETDYRYLMLQNISDGDVGSTLPYLKDIDVKYKKYCLKDRNLIISKTSPFKVALARVENGESILANGNLYFIELDEEQVNPVFVQLFFQSEAGIAQLNRYAKGALLKSISIQDLKTIHIPNVPKEKQDKVAEKYADLQDELKVIRRQEDLVRGKMANLLEGVI